MNFCHYHPEQPAVGLCMRCRAAICAACCTRLDGINHCHACLKAMAARPAKPPRRASGLLSAGIVLVAAWGILYGLMLLAQGGLAP
ncbi:MAG TPA: hypothetical protein VE988_08975 [Gemmataceae bacterium]|nr:hypothetical protein [Gemmataceae bacterium]